MHTFEKTFDGILLRFPMFLNTLTEQFVQRERKLPPGLKRKNILRHAIMKRHANIE